ncbi:MAG: tRNA preQ1(34) S-adenosylmethionine ribosyltransferase-isomerase QueA [bacterium]
MNLCDFSYSLPRSFIAQEPMKEREKCKMLFFDKKKERIEHLIFSDILNLLSAKDALMLNKTRVFPARLIKDGTDILLVKEIEKNIWEVLAKPRKKINKGQVLDFGRLKGEVISCFPIVVKFNCNGNLFDILEEIGKAPLPPYIKRNPEDEDKIYYQTVYAKDYGSIAAPTAGLHFTDEILLKLKENEVSIAYLTLHIGLGTFKTVRCSDIREHRMDGEYVRIEEKIPKDKRIIACGTSVVRALESGVRGQESGVRGQESGVRFWTDLFIYPGFKFKIISGLLTNFHLPESPPFIMTSAFVGLDELKMLYSEAKEKNYRFGSYGDCMIVL